MVHLTDVPLQHPCQLSMTFGALKRGILSSHPWQIQLLAEWGSGKSSRQKVDSVGKTCPVCIHVSSEQGP